MKNFILLLTISFISLPSFAQYTKFVWDTITFEEPYEYLKIDTSSRNIWQIGEPNKIFFDSAFSTNNAIVTDTLNNYPVNNYSFFDLYIGLYNNPWYYFSNFIEIKHKFDTDTLKDGGYITVSYDNGQTWMNIIHDTSYTFGVPPNQENWFLEKLYSDTDTLFNGEYGFSGNSNGWITTKFSWFDIPSSVKSLHSLGDTMIIRFNFISDNFETNNEGWMIDNIKLYSVDLGGGVDEIKPLEFSIYPNPMNQTTTIKLNNYSKIELSILDIQGQIVSKTKYFNNQSIRINRGKLNSGIYFVKIRKDKNLVGIKKLIVE